MENVPIVIDDKAIGFVKTVDYEKGIIECVLWARFAGYSTGDSLQIRCDGCQARVSESFVEAMRGSEWGNNEQVQSNL